MSLKSKLKSIFLHFDLFNSPVYLKIYQQPHYSTIFGGIFSLIILVTFVAIFFNSLLVVLTKVNINATEENVQDLDSDSHFTDLVFSIGIEGIDLNSVNRYFDVTLTYKQHKNYSKIPYKQDDIQLVKCNRSYWQSIDPNFGQLYQIYNMNQMLCPHSNQDYRLNGHEASMIYEYLQFRVQKCTNSTNFSINCYSNVDIDNFISNILRDEDYLKVRFFIIDATVNGENSIPVTKYINRNIFLPFTKTMGTKGKIALGEYSILTDQSVLPFSIITEQLGHFVAVEQTHSIQLRSDHYIRLVLQKSSLQKNISRNHGKIDEMLSYIGGLFGLVFAFFGFFLNSYSEYCYELNVSQSIFQNKSAREINFNFWTYIKYKIYTLISFIGCKINYPQMQRIQQAKQQVEKQLDVKLIMKKLQLCLNLCQLLLEQNQKLKLYSKLPPKIQEISHIRKLLQQLPNQWENSQKQLKQTQQAVKDYRNKIVPYNYDNENSQIDIKPINKQKIKLQKKNIQIQES